MPDGLIDLSNLPPKAELTKVGLVLADDVSYDEWCEVGAILRDRHRVDQWALGDWWRHAADRDKIQHSGEWSLLRPANYSTDTYESFAWVCRRVPVERRKVGVSFGHHKTVAGHTPDQQVELLRLCDEKKWSIQQLRDYIKVHGSTKSEAVPNQQAIPEKETVLPPQRKSGSLAKAKAEAQRLDPAARQEFAIWFADLLGTDESVPI